MNEKAALRLAACAAALTLISTVTASATMARYVSGADIYASDSVAAWQVEMGDMSVSAGGVSESNESVFAQKIAPGMAGSIEIEIKTNNQVEAQAKAILRADTPIPKGMTVNGAPYSQEGWRAEALIPVGERTTVLSFAWEWAFEGNDENDMLFAGKEISFTATVEVAQLPPK